MNYYDTFITVADDCPARSSVVPEAKPDRAKPVAVIQHELLSQAPPYTYTMEDVLFETYVRHKGLAGEPKERLAELRREFFAKPQPCLRTSPLARRYGWGFHFDEEGRVALCPQESSDYQRHIEVSQDGPKLLKAFRSSRG